MTDDTGRIDDPQQDELALDEAAHLAEGFEGFSAPPYQDPAGIWTVGFGSIWTWCNGRRTGRVCAATPPVTRDEAHQWMEWELSSVVGQIAGAVRVPLTADEKAALYDFTYNLGIGNLSASTLLRKLNAGDYEGAAQEFAKWNRAGGVVLAGLVRRRAAEAEMFERGIQA